MTHREEEEVDSAEEEAADSVSNVIQRLSFCMSKYNDILVN